MALQGLKKGTTGIIRNGLATFCYHYIMGKSSRKVAPRFYCPDCDYATSKKSNWTKHLGTTKHQNGNNGNKNGKNGNSGRRFICPFCSACYKFQSGLSRHSKKCPQAENEVVDFADPKVAKSSHPDNGGSDGYSKMKDTLQTLVASLAKQDELIEKLIDQQGTMLPMVGSNNNNKISVNVFLNNHCKDAMNLSDFLKGIQVSLEDLQYTSQHGYVKGISNIFNKHLTDMKVTERPIHCSDQKRLQFYIKEDDSWEKDKRHHKIDESIQTITKKQILHIKEWEKCHPGYLDDGELNKEWNQMIYSMMGGADDGAREKNSENIKKTICKNISVREALKSD